MEDEWKQVEWPMAHPSRNPNPNPNPDPSLTLTLTLR